MSARQLQPSEYEIQREVEALRDLRRRSTTPGALTIDPDLPNQPSPTSPTGPYRITKSPVTSIANSDLTDSNGLGEGSTSSNRSHNADSSRVPDNPAADDPLHLFWVPASLHPEIAPAEFRAFLKEHARSPPPSDGNESQLSSSPSSSSSMSINRKRSMLSRQYRPKENDGVEEENVFPIKRNRSFLYPKDNLPQLTISDLQKLEELAEESNDPTKLRNVLRRSLSMNISPSAINTLDEMPDMGDEADSPIIVPPPGQILRRAARTKIRKPSLPGDGGGHRFGLSRRGQPAAASAEPRTSSEMSSSDHGEPEATSAVLRRPTISEEGGSSLTRPESYSEETFIYDAYARDDDEESSIALPAPVPTTTPILIPAAPVSEPLTIPSIVDEPPQISTELLSVEPEPLATVLHQPQPQRLAVPQALPEQTTPSRTPSPSESVATSEKSSIVPSAPFVSTPPTTPPPQQTRKEKEKDKKGLFGKWGSDKSSKKNKQDKEKGGSSEKDKDAGFFGSLFGKKKQETEFQSSITGGPSGREAAQALLGASKSSKSYVPSTSPGLAPGIGGNPYARYPIHVERAIYRLSHIKLANPRRPLYEQVLISNLMFWYLGVINRAQNPTPTPTQPVTNSAPNVGVTASQEDTDSDEKEKDQRERDQREKEQRERAEREKQEKEQRERELEQKKKESGRKGSLTKTSAGGAQGGRRAEMPVKGPQYEMQHRVMEQEYGVYNGQTRGVGTSIPTANGTSSQGYGRPQQPDSYSNSPSKMIQPQQQLKGQPEQFYYQPQPDNSHQRQGPGLPPGAMPPVDQVAWMSQGGSPMLPSQQMQQISNQQPNANANGPRRSQSPPNNRQPPQQPHQWQYAPQNNQPMQLQQLNTSQESLGDRTGGNYRGPGRSLSATASTSPALPTSNGVSLRKGNSAHAAVPYDKRPRTAEARPPSGEEEDVPLAVWQQQAQRRR